MGVQGLWELLAPVGRRVSVEALANKTVAVDASIWLVQFMKAMRDERGDMLRNAHLLGFFRRICKLLFLRIRPVFVFDGGTPALKRRTLLARRKMRENAATRLRKTAEKLLLTQVKLRHLRETRAKLQPGTADVAGAEAVVRAARGRGGGRSRGRGRGPRGRGKGPSRGQAGATHPSSVDSEALQSEGRSAADEAEGSGPSTNGVADRGEEDGRGASREVMGEGATGSQSTIAEAQAGGAKDEQEAAVMSAEEQERMEALQAAWASDSDEAGEETLEYESSGKEWDGEEEGAQDESDDGAEEFVLPNADHMDPAVLATLPPSVQLELLVQMREHLVAENRVKFHRVAKAPGSFSELQLEAYLRTAAMRKGIDEVHKKSAAAFAQAAADAAAAAAAAAAASGSHSAGRTRPVKERQGPGPGDHTEAASTSTGVGGGFVGSTSITTGDGGPVRVYQAPDDSNDTRQAGNSLHSGWIGGMESGEGSPKRRKLDLASSLFQGPKLARKSPERGFGWAREMGRGGGRGGRRGRRKSAASVLEGALASAQFAPPPPADPSPSMLSKGLPGQWPLHLAKPSLLTRKGGLGGDEVEVSPAIGDPDGSATKPNGGGRAKGAGDYLGLVSEAGASLQEASINGTMDEDGRGQDAAGTDMAEDRDLDAGVPGADQSGTGAGEQEHDPLGAALAAGRLAQEAMASVATYRDEKGVHRVSRIRGLGVRMTRDLQWNLQLIREREKQGGGGAEQGEDALARGSVKPEPVVDVEEPNVQQTLHGSGAPDGESEARHEIIVAVEVDEEKAKEAKAETRNSTGDEDADGLDDFFAMLVAQGGAKGRHGPSSISTTGDPGSSQAQTSLLAAPKGCCEGSGGGDGSDVEWEDATEQDLPGYKIGGPSATGIEAGLEVADTQHGGMNGLRFKDTHEPDLLPFPQAAVAESATLPAVGSSAAAVLVSASPEPEECDVEWEDEPQPGVPAPDANEAAMKPAPGNKGNPSLSITQEVRLDPASASASASAPASASASTSASVLAARGCSSVQDSLSAQEAPADAAAHASRSDHTAAAPSGAPRLQALLGPMSPKSQAHKECTADLMPPAGTGNGERDGGHKEGVEWQEEAGDDGAADIELQAAIQLSLQSHSAEMSAGPQEDRAGSPDAAAADVGGAKGTAATAWALASCQAGNANGENDQAGTSQNTASPSAGAPGLRVTTRRKQSEGQNREVGPTVDRADPTAQGGRVLSSDGVAEVKSAGRAAGEQGETVMRTPTADDEGRSRPELGSQGSQAADEAGARPSPKQSQEECDAVRGPESGRSQAAGDVGLGPEVGRRQAELDTEAVRESGRSPADAEAGLGPGTGRGSSGMDMGLEAALGRSQAGLGGRAGPASGRSKAGPDEGSGPGPGRNQAESHVGLEPEKDSSQAGLDTGSGPGAAWDLGEEDLAAAEAELEAEREALLQQQRAGERDAATVSSDMLAECQELLQLFGVPYIVAPMEAEAQCAFLNSAGLVDAVVTDDCDVFLFGGATVWRNLFDEKKYVEVYEIRDVEGELGLTRDRLIRMGMLLGCDYTPGISGIGIVNAIEAINAYPGPDGLERFRDWVESPDVSLLEAVPGRKGRGGGKGKAQDKGQGSAGPTGPEAGSSGAETGNTEGGGREGEGGAVEEGEEIAAQRREFEAKHRAISKNWVVPEAFPSEAVVEAFQNPKVDSSKDKFSWLRPDLPKLRMLCQRKLGMEGEKADEYLMPVMRAHESRETQMRLEAFYSFNQRFAKVRSQRIRKAVTGITGKSVAHLVLKDASDDGEDAKAQENGSAKHARKVTRRDEDAEHHSRATGLKHGSDVEEYALLPADLQAANSTAALGSMDKGSRHGKKKASRREGRGQPVQEAPHRLRRSKRARIEQAGATDEPTQNPSDPEQGSENSSPSGSDDTFEPGHDSAEDGARGRPSHKKPRAKQRGMHNGRSVASRIGVNSGSGTIERGASAGIVEEAAQGEKQNGGATALVGSGKQKCNGASANELYEDAPVLETESIGVSEGLAGGSDSSFLLPAPLLRKKRAVQADK